MKIDKVFIDVTNKCNANCIYCFTNSNTKTHNELEDEEVVDLFNDILKIEASVLKEGEFNDLSVTEMHIIEAIGLDREMTMTEVARDLEITVSIPTKYRDIYSCGIGRCRKRIEEDRRVVLIKLTEKGDEAFKSHADFHDDMIKSIMKELPKDEEEILITALKKMVNFFEEKYNLKK